jgi:hypothetical protein
MRSILIPVTICSLLVTAKMQAQSNDVCTPTTAGQLSMQTNTNLFKSILGSAGAGIAVMTLGKANPLVRLGALLVLLVPLSDLITTYDQKQQLDSRPDWKSNTVIGVCATRSIMATIGVRHLESEPKMKLDKFDDAVSRLSKTSHPHLGSYLYPQK